MGKFMSITEDKKSEETTPKRAFNPKIIKEENKAVNIPRSLDKIINEGEFQIKAPKYTTIDHGRLQVSYAAIKDDYYYQIEVKGKTPLRDEDITAAIIEACASVVPSQNDVYISPPPPKMEIEWRVFTVIVKGAVKLLGAKEFMETKLVNRLLEMPLWPKSILKKRGQ
jgi:hypothetical protein